jgi:hypothetical protein
MEAAGGIFLIFAARVFGLELAVGSWGIGAGAGPFGAYQVQAH